VQNFWELRFIFVGLSAVVFNFGQGLPMEQLIPNKSIRLLITGLMFAGSGSLVAITTRKLSGGHVNPLSQFAFWLQGKMHQHDIWPYIGQFRRNYWCSVVGNCLG